MPDGTARDLDVAETVAKGFAAVFGARLRALVVYGSAADGSYVPGFSDLDLACFLDGPLGLADAAALHARLSGLDVAPFDYLQVKYVDTSAPATRELVPGSFQEVLGTLALGPYVHDDASLRDAAERFLANLPALVRDDVATWSVATTAAHRRRHVRLVATRVKPAVRATLSTRGTPPTAAYRLDWTGMADGLDELDASAGAALRALRAALGVPEDTSTVRAGELGLSLLVALSSER